MAHIDVASLAHQTTNTLAARHLAGTTSVVVVDRQAVLAGPLYSLADSTHAALSGVERLVLLLGDSVELLDVSRFAAS